MENDPELILEYVAESREHLSQIESIFREIEKMKGKVEHDHLHSLFRSIHTIKGSAGFLGFTNVGKLTHAMESLLAKLRDNCRQLPETIAKHLWKAPITYSACSKTSIAVTTCRLGIWKAA